MEGTFKGADDSAVRIETGGRVLTFTPEQVRAIYYGASPSSKPEPLLERAKAITALEALRSVAQPAVAYGDYALHVKDAQIAVDQYVQKSEEGPAIRGAIADSMHFYALAGSAWNASRSRGNYADVGSDRALARCGPAQRVIAESKRTNTALWRSKGPGEAAATGMVIGNGGLPALWACASDKLAEAEKLQTGEKK